MMGEGVLKGGVMEEDVERRVGVSSRTFARASGEVGREIPRKSPRPVRESTRRSLPC